MGREPIISPRGVSHRARRYLSWSSAPFGSNSTQNQRTCLPRKSHPFSRFLTLSTVSSSRCLAALFRAAPPLGFMSSELCSTQEAETSLDAQSFHGVRTILFCKGTYLFPLLRRQSNQVARLVFCPHRCEQRCPVFTWRKIPCGIFTRQIHPNKQATMQQRKPIPTSKGFVRLSSRVFKAKW